MATFNRNLDLDARMENVLAIEACKNLINRRSYFYANNERAEELDELWVKEPENRKTASFGRNWGFYVGMDEIRKYYVDGNKTAEVGFCSFHPMTTCSIEMADDGKTCYALCYAWSFDTNGNGDGTADAYWVSENIAFDFIKEADGWKIWHVFDTCDLFCHAGQPLSDQPADIYADEFPPVENPYKTEFGTPTLDFAAVGLLAYDPKYNYSAFPYKPKVHASYAPDCGCGPECCPKYAEFIERSAAK